MNNVYTPNPFIFHVPKIAFCIRLNIQEKIKPRYISSVQSYSMEIQSRIGVNANNANANNVYEYLYTKVPNTNTPVCKINGTQSNQSNGNSNGNSNSILFFELFEILSNSYIQDWYSHQTEPVKSLHISRQWEISVNSLQLAKPSMINVANGCESVPGFHLAKYSFIFMETLNEHDWLQSILVVLYYQKYGGIFILKVNAYLELLLEEIVFYISSMFDKTIIIKPTVSNSLTFESFIIFIHYSKDSVDTLANKQHSVVSLRSFVHSPSPLSPLTYHSILNAGIPNYFSLRITDVNVIIGQKRIEQLNAIISSLYVPDTPLTHEKNKRNKIQKAVQWCEKYHIPYNKFIPLK